MLVYVWVKPESWRNSTDEQQMLLEGRFEGWPLGLSFDDTRARERSEVEAVEEDMPVAKCAVTHPPKKEGG
jgi:hypothetical protein